MNNKKKRVKFVDNRTATPQAEVFGQVGEKTVLWTETLWAGVKPVLKCEVCGEFRDSEDEIILHVVSHYPEDQRNQILDQLVKKE